MVLKFVLLMKMAMLLSEESRAVENGARILPKISGILHGRPIQGFL